MQKYKCAINGNCIVPTLVEGDDRFSEVDDPDMYYIEEKQIRFTPKPDTKGTFYFDTFYVVVADWEYTNENKEWARSIKTGEYTDITQPNWPGSDVYIAPYQSAYEVMEELNRESKAKAQIDIRSGFTCDALGETYRYTSKPDDVENLMGTINKLLHLSIAVEHKAGKSKPKTPLSIDYFCYDLKGNKVLKTHTAEQFFQVGEAFYAFKMYHVALANVYSAALHQIFASDLDEEAKIEKIKNCPRKLPDPPKKDKETTDA